MDLPFLLGTAFSTDRTRAKALGYVLHFVAGIVFAVVYWLIFLAIGRPRRRDHGAVPKHSSGACVP